MIGGRRMVRRTTVLVALMVWMTSFADVRADSFPPFGAWAYGSGSAPAGVYRGRTVVRSRPAWPVHGGWGTVNVVRSRSMYRPYARVYAPVYSSFGWSYWPAPSYAFYPAYIPRYRVTYGYVPTYRLHTFYPVVPYCATVAVPLAKAQTSQPVVVASKAAARTAGSVTNNSRPSAAPSLAQVNPIGGTTTDSVVTNAHGTKRVGSQASSAIRLVSTTAQDRDDYAAALSLADEMMRMGGYEEAAVAYARIFLRHGQSRTLFERRYVAQILAGNYSQAEIILNSAVLNDSRIDGQSLPGDPAVAFDVDRKNCHVASEALAQRAYENQSDSLPMLSVATWLRIMGDHDRASLFERAHSQLTLQSNK